MVSKGLLHASRGCVGEHTVKTVDGFALNLLWYRQVGVGADGGWWNGAMDEVEESVFFAGSYADSSGRYWGRVGEESCRWGEDHIGFVGVDEGADGAHRSRGLRGKEDIVAVAGGAVVGDAEGVTIDALEDDGAARTDVGEPRASGLNVSRGTTVDDGFRRAVGG